MTAAILEAELQSDLEAIYKIAGDLLTELEGEKFSDCPFSEAIKFKLEDITGTLQKDIFNLRYISTKEKAGGY